MKTKKCQTCEEVKVCGEFYKRKDGYKDLYRSDCKSCLAKKSASRYSDNPEKYNQMSKKWRNENPEKEAARGRIRRRDKRLEENRRQREWRKKNPEKAKEIVRRFIEKNPHHYNYYCSLRRAAKKSATPKWLNSDQKKRIKIFYEIAQQLKTRTQIDHHVDHIIPLQNGHVCGLHVPWNLQVITATENHEKNNKYRLR